MGADGRSWSPPSSAAQSPPTAPAAPITAPAAAAMMIGGAVQGGRIVTDWPGLATGSLFEGRDLKPTLALDKVIASACAEAFDLDPEHSTRVLFPDTDRYKAVPRLLRT